MKKNYLCVFLLLAMTLGGCGVKKQSVCKPVLFPYIEYNYKAESKKLSESHTHKIEDIVDFGGVKVPIPNGWEFEKISDLRSLKVFKDKQNFFSLSFYKNNPLQSHDTKMLKMIGCMNFSGLIENVKTSKDFYTDLFFLTENDITNGSFWHYYILWAKTNNLRHSSQLIHYTGKNLEAFKINFDSGIDCRHRDIKIKITIFPRKINPDYLSILSSGLSSGIEDDAFFVGFLEMLDAIN